MRTGAAQAAQPWLAGCGSLALASPLRRRRAGAGVMALVREAEVTRVAFRRLAPFHTEAFGGCGLNRLGGGERTAEGFAARVFGSPATEYLPFAGLDPLCVRGGAGGGGTRLAWQPAAVMTAARVLVVPAGGGGAAPVAGYAVLGTAGGAGTCVAAHVRALVRAGGEGGRWQSVALWGYSHSCNRLGVGAWAWVPRLGCLGVGAWALVPAHALCTDPHVRVQVPRGRGRVRAR